ncbi:MAG TPA: rhodanese-like domain-containing protein [Gammaproteobacteria bacterium]|nr:rhodanese-like domain-containing protein [Gammaproteobacteria bacterium]
MSHWTMTRGTGLLIGGLLLSPAGGALAADELGPIKRQGDYVSPERVEGATTIGPARAHALWQKDRPFVDPRTKTDFQVGHIPGAVRLQNDPDVAWTREQSVAGEQELEALTPGALRQVAAKDEPVVFYCNGTDCARSSNSAALAVKWGWDKVYYYRRGFPAWQDADYPVATAEQWPEETRGVDYYLDHPEKARWVNNMCDKISFNAWTPEQEEHCKEAKFGLLQFLQQRSEGQQGS